MTAETEKAKLPEEIAQLLRRFADAHHACGDIREDEASQETWNAVFDEAEEATDALEAAIAQALSAKPQPAAPDGVAQKPVAWVRNSEITADEDAVLLAYTTFQYAFDKLRYNRLDSLRRAIIEYLREAFAPPPLVPDEAVKAQDQAKELLAGEWPGGFTISKDQTLEQMVESIREGARKALSSRPADGAQEPEVVVQSMKLPSGLMYYFVIIRQGERELPIFSFRDERYKADYHAAELEWLLNGKEKPDPLKYGPDAASAGKENDQ